MNHENTSKLYNNFPELYRARHLDETESSLAAWGVEFHDGWLSLIYHLSEEIHNCAAVAGIEPEDSSYPCVSQVKQKSGTLRFYMSDASEEMRVRIRKAEDESANICEICGDSGELMPIKVGRPFFKARCPKHVKD